MSIRLKLSILFGLLFLGAILNAAFLFKLEQYGEERLGWVEHTHEVLDTAHLLFGDLRDAETGQRGYLLTENAQYLEPYHTGVMSAKNHLIELKRLTQASPDQNQMLERIEKEINLKFAELAKTIELVNSGDKNKALQLVQGHTGKRYMDNIRLSLNRFTNNEQLLMEQRKGDVKENRAKITTLITVEIVFFIVLSMITLSYLQRGLFDPLKRLLANVRKIEGGSKLHVADVVETNEMGHLLSTFYMMSEKISERTEELDYKAHHDELTGLKNRLLVYSEIEEAVELAQTKGEKIAVLFIDLNFFKQVNDTLGHDVGDLLLKETASRLEVAVRSSDTVFRLGGDEFLVVAKEVKERAGVQRLVDNIFKEFERPAIIYGDTMEISISMGVAISPDDTTDNRELIKYSDIAMYTAKRDPGCDYQFFDKNMLKRAADSD